MPVKHGHALFIDLLKAHEKNILEQTDKAILPLQEKLRSMLAPDLLTKLGD